MAAASWRRARAVAARQLPGLYGWYSAFRRRRLEKRVKAILARPEDPDCRSSVAAFDRLQAEASGVAEYGYDPFSTWKRGADRAAVLLALGDGLREPGARVLEAGCGDGMTAYLLAGFGHEVTVSDAEDWRDARVRHLPFVEGDMAQLGLVPEGYFDLVYSYNSFEHFADPTKVLHQLARACRPRGLLYLEFGPLYCGPWGLHAYRTLRMPYPQFLFSGEFINRKLEELGIEDLGRKRTSLQPLNRWRVAQFRDLWSKSGCDVIRCEVGWVDGAHLRMIEAFPGAFRGRGLTLEDVLTQSLTVLLRTPER